MTRTPGDVSRRRGIADAAGGFPTRTTVVLYACIAQGQDTNEVRARLRRYAEARDWLVAGEVIDHTSAATPVTARPGWPNIAELITTGVAKGIVTTSRASAPGFDALDEWLTDHQAFLSEEVTPTAAATEGAMR